MKVFEMYRRSFASRITLAVAAVGAVLSIAELVLIYALVGVELRQTADFAVDAGIIVAGLVAMLAAFVIITNIMVRRFVAPLNEVVDSIKAACEGEIGRKVEIRTEDEIGTLAIVLQPAARPDRLPDQADARVLAPPGPVVERDPRRHRAAGLRLRRAGRVDRRDDRHDGGAREHLSPDRRERRPGRHHGRGLARQRRVRVSRRCSTR